jgi:GNAT superfamily N-acetyltransferase
MSDTSTMTIRQATSDDAGAIAALFTDEGYPAGPSDIAARLERFSPPDAAVFVAEHDGALLGFIAVHSLPRFEHGDTILRIMALVVDAGARERGVGRALIAEVERIGTAHGAAFVELTAGHHRPDARHLYESLGYDATVAAYLRKKL